MYTEASSEGLDSMWNRQQADNTQSQLSQYLTLKIIVNHKKQRRIDRKSVNRIKTTSSKRSVGLPTVSIISCSLNTQKRTYQDRRRSAREMHFTWPHTCVPTMQLCAYMKRGSAYEPPVKIFCLYNSLRRLNVLWRTAQCSVNIADFWRQFTARVSVSKMQWCQFWQVAVAL